MNMTTALRVNQNLLERYKNLAKATDRSRSYYMNKALEDSIARFEYEYGILKDLEEYRSGKEEAYSLDEVRKHLGLED
ncbi:antitoxin [Alloscardovia theropitheci]|uniref:Antitoxin n=1 Tax=Alloscardovia theropitheci TaxID=2496842 RepID=A0A4R0QXJ9_9BIFI|nr:ribbon-helix-helix domain-containing protein [Alloscardovia theropitheci]TCD54340.1 antitoxin [Alloscardovia theropitheci]